MSVGVLGRSYIHTRNANLCPLIYGDRLVIVDAWAATFYPANERSRSINLAKPLGNKYLKQLYIVYAWRRSSDAMRLPFLLWLLITFYACQFPTANTEYVEVRMTLWVTACVRRVCAWNHLWWNGYTYGIIANSKLMSDHINRIYRVCVFIFIQIYIAQYNPATIEA